MKVKICGITSVEDARTAARAGADAVGLNFYRQSPRFITPQAAAMITAALPPFVEPVGVFVDAPADVIRQTCRQARLHTVQLHGDEPPDLPAQLGELRVIRAHRLGPDGIAALADDLAQAQQCGRAPDAVLIDAHVEGLYGGSGQTAPWQVLADGYRRDQWPPLILAGGLTPENVAEAIRSVQPWGVDVAGGVEDAPGKKSAAKIERFIAEARAAFAALQAGPAPS